MDEFLRRFVTVDETWINHNTPETNQQPKQWVSPGESSPEKAKMGLSTNKVMATVFWEARGIIHIDYLQRTINDEYYANLSDRFNTSFKKQRPHFAKEIVIFHQDNAWVHICLVSMVKFHEFGLRIAPSSALFSGFSPE